MNSETDIRQIIEEQIKQVAAQHDICIDNIPFVPSYVMKTSPGHYPLTYGEIVSYASPIRLQANRLDVTFKQSTVYFKVINSYLLINIEALIKHYKPRSELVRQIDSELVRHIDSNNFALDGLTSSIYPSIMDTDLISGQHGFKVVDKNANISLCQDDITSRLNEFFIDFLDEINNLIACEDLRRILNPGGKEILANS